MKTTVASDLKAGGRKAVRATLFLCVLVIAVVFFGMYAMDLIQYLSYLWYEDMVRETVREMVEPACLISIN